MASLKLNRKSGLDTPSKNIRATRLPTEFIMAKSPIKKSEKPMEDVSYEDAMIELEGIVAALEDGQNPLEDSMKLFERGQALVTHCSALLESAQLKVQKLVGESVVAFEEESE
jgi:exodeoxyribonuclease VII small subunit